MAHWLDLPSPSPSFSIATGPLYQWAESQIKYSSILRKVKPLRDEVEKLEEQSQDLVHRQKLAVAEVDSLEGAIKQYKMEYACAIRDTELIRGEMDSVRKKVNRAESLLRSLEQEKERWAVASSSFDKQVMQALTLTPGHIYTYLCIVLYSFHFISWRVYAYTCRCPL